MDGNTKPSVFIVEDETVVAMDIQDVLTGFGYRIEGIAKTGEDALERIPASLPDIVLMDIHLAGEMDGIETADRVHAEYHIPVIFLTAYADDALIERAKRTLPFGYIIKPFGERELHSAIEIAIYKSGMEKRLSESEEKFRTLFNCIPDALCYCRIVCDANGDATDLEILNVNPEFLDIAPAAGPAGALFSQTSFLHEDSSGRFLALCTRVAKTGIPESVDTLFGRQNRWLRAHVSCQGGDRIIAIFVDVTESKMAAEALRLSNQKLNLLSNITRHDIRNQIQALYGYFGLLRIKLEGTPWFDYILKGAQAVDTIEKQISFTKEYQDLGMQNPEWQSVRQCIDRAVAALPMGDIRVDHNTGGLEIYADPLFEKVFYNLIDNALRYGGAKMKEIRISTQKSGPDLVISVEDDGIGIATEDKSRLFTKGFGKNTGLGLFLSQEILAITGISITETGESGSGARFEICVPEGESRYLENPGESQCDAPAQDNTNPSHSIINNPE